MPRQISQTAQQLVVFLNRTSLGTVPSRAAPLLLALGAEPFSRHLQFNCRLHQKLEDRLLASVTIDRQRLLGVEWVRKSSECMRPKEELRPKTKLRY